MIHALDTDPDTVLIRTGNLTEAGYDSFHLPAQLGVYSLDFNAANGEFAEVQDDPLLDLSTSWTVEAWLKPHNVATGSFQYLVSKWNGGRDASDTMEMG